MKKVTNENMKLLVDALYKSVGTDEFGKGKIYYQDGSLK
jgi:hypothetical protein